MGEPQTTLTSFPELYLHRALRAEAPQARIAEAEAGLALHAVIDDDTRVLLLRQVYLGHLELRQLQKAVDVATDMGAVGILQDIAHHDRARALQALGRLDEAIIAQRFAARTAPTARKSFHGWCLGTLQHFAGQSEEALSSMRRGLRYAKDDGPLLRAHAAMIALDSDQPVANLAAVIEALEHSASREGYGRFLLGMLYTHVGDVPKAAVYLRAFLRHNAAISHAKALTLREELRRARVVLAKLAN